nr:zinc finger BED domain-containing protein RICESLEEPER 2-like [Ipomoea batatas]
MGSLILDCNTRWNSTYLRLSATLKYRTTFNRMAGEDKLYDAYFQEAENGKRRVGPPSSNDWDNVIGLSSLTPYMVDALILTQDWLQSSLQSDATVSLIQILEETEFMYLLVEEIRKLAGQHHDIDL